MGKGEMRVESLVDTRQLHLDGTRDSPRQWRQNAQSHITSVPQNYQMLTIKGPDHLHFKVMNVGHHRKTKEKKSSHN